MSGKLPAQIAIVAATAAAVFGIISMTRGLVDADYYWHVTAGRLVAESGILTTDPFSYTWGGQAWVMHEWAGQLLIHRLVQTIGPTATSFLFGAIATAGPLAIALALRSRVPFPALAAVWVLSLYLLTPYVTIRPQVLSWMFLGLVVAGMLVVRPHHRRLPWLAIPLIIVWANVHGLVVIGLGVLATYALLTFVGWTPMASARRRTVLVFVAAAAASMATPAGPAGSLYPLRYVEAGDWGLQHIGEWQSPNFHDPAQLGLLLFIAALLGNGMRATPRWVSVMTVCGVIGGLLATRNVPLTALLGMPALAFGLGDRYSAWRPPVVALPRHVILARRGMEVALALVIVAATATIVPRMPQVSGQQAIPRYFPVESVSVLADHRPDGRIFAEYGWGGYVIHQLYDSGARVFVDGRNDMYSEEILEDFVTIRNAEDGWQATLARWGADAILLPATAPLTRGPAQGEGWCEVHEAEVSVLLLPCDATHPTARQ